MGVCSGWTGLRRGGGGRAQIQETNKTPQKSIPKYAVNGPKIGKGLDMPKAVALATTMDFVLFQMKGLHNRKKYTFHLYGILGLI